MKRLCENTCGRFLMILATLAAGHSVSGAAMTSMTDLGGGARAVSGGWSAIFGNGGGICNGTLDATISGWWTMSGVTFTVGPGGVINTQVDSSSSGQGEINFGGGATLIIDGGTVNSNNRRNNDSTSNGCYIGDSGNAPNNYALLRLENGGTFNSTYQYVRFGTNNGKIGRLSVNDGVMNIRNGGREFVLCYNASTAIVNATNFTLVASALRLCENAAALVQSEMVDSDITVQRVYKTKEQNDGSFFRFDGTVFHTATAGVDFFGPLTVPYELVGNGLAIDTAHDVSASGTFSGSGPLKKRGGAMFTFAGTYLGTGNLVLEGGTLNFGATAFFDHAVRLVAADNSTIRAPLTEDGVLGASSLVFVPNPQTTGRVNVVIDAQITPESGVDYLLFAGGGSAETLKRIAVPSGYRLETDVAGRIFVKMEPITHVWTDAAASDHDWTTGGNWNSLRTPVSFDSLRFEGEGGLTGPNLDASVVLQTVDFVSGAWTLSAPSQIVAQAVNIAAGSTVTLAATNQLPTAAGIVALEGVLDLGGQAQDFEIAKQFMNNQDVLRNGCEIRNGTLNLSFPGWWTMSNGSFTVGPNATLVTLPARGSASQGEWNLQNGACLTIDGGTVVLQNLRSVDSGHYIGCDTPNTATVRIINGGVLHDLYRYLRIGFNGGATGVLSVDRGTVNVADGAQELRVAASQGAIGHGIVAFTNATLIAQAIRIAESGDNGLAQITLKDSDITIQRIYRNRTPLTGSFFLIDGTTFTTVAGGVDYFGNLGYPYQIEAGGVTLNAQHDVTASGSFSGTGALVKTGPGRLMVNGRYFAGPIEVREGGIGFGAQSVATGAKVKMAGGTTIQLAFSSVGIGGAPEVDLDIDETTEGEVTLSIDFQTDPLFNTEYPLFRSISETAAERLVANGILLRRDASGMFYFKVTPTTHLWTGGGAENTWQTAANWDSNKTPVRYDSLRFNGAGMPSVCDLASVMMQNVTFESGAWAVDVTNATLAASKSFSILTGAELTLLNPSVNPLPTGYEVLAIGGVLDLGGAQQTVNSRTKGEGVGVFRTGGELRNGTLTIIEPSTGGTGDWWFWNNGVDFTIGTGATVIFPKQTDQRGQINFKNSHLKIDGGELQALNARSSGAYVGNNGNAVIEVVNGGRFYHPNAQCTLGFANDGPGAGALLGNEAEIDFGAQNLFLGDRNQSRSTLALTNSTLTCKTITFSLKTSSTPGPQIVEFVGTEVGIERFAVNKLGTGSSLTFDGATLTSPHSSPLPALGIPYTLAAGGLTVKVPDAEENAAALELGGAFAGTGDLRLVHEGDAAAKAVSFNGTAATLTGNLVVAGVALTALEKTLSCGLVAHSGTTLDVSSSVFGGGATIEEDVTFAGLDPEVDYERPMTLVRARGQIVSPLLNRRQPGTRNRFFIGRSDGTLALQYGVPPGFTVFVR